MSACPMAEGLGNPLEESSLEALLPLPLEGLLMQCFSPRNTKG